MNQIFETFDDFIEEFRKFSYKTFSIWTTYPSKKWTVVNTSFYILNANIIETLKKLQLQVLAHDPFKSYVLPCNCMAEIRINRVVIHFLNKIF